ncbi:MAG TPA: GTPase [Phycisphaerales bacterium]|nr:GTPase [Phycisphaerales bacterium]
MPAPLAATQASSHPAHCRCVLSTPREPGAIAVISLLGDPIPALQHLTNRSDWPIGVMRLVNFLDIDEGLAGCLTSTLAQIMPHGGPHVVRTILDALDDFGVEMAHGTALLSINEIRTLFPEAQDEIEALALHTISISHSPFAIDLLLQQSARWKNAGGIADFKPTPDDLACSTRLAHLIHPPLVVLTGPANVGKSTLTNALIGRTVSITADAPGTTRDYTTALLDLAGLTVRWHDTPGLRETTDPIERHAMMIAHTLLSRADFIIAITDADHPWPKLPRDPDLSICSKSDLAVRSDADLCVSAQTSQNLTTFAELVRDRLVPPADIASNRPWIFDQRLIT